LRRRFPDYFADTKTAALGAAPKYILKSNNPCDPQYIVKYAEKHGQRETLTEFFTNQLGMALGLKMAHSGLIRSDNDLTFVSQIFIDEDETLTHGSLIIEDCFKRESSVDVHELDRIQHRTEQEFFSIDFVRGVLRDFCGKDFDAIFPIFIEMLVFDCLVGSMDRHSQNWGVLSKSKGPSTYRFAPIFDTARSLLWSLDENQIELLAGENTVDLQKRKLCEGRLLKHIEKAQPCIGPVRNHPKVNKCNHFDFVGNLMDLYPDETAPAVRKVTSDVELKSARLLRQFPFRMGFTGKRRRIILKILAIRAGRLREILKKGEPRHEDAVEASIHTTTADAAGVV
jgi:hypothetical protein